MAGLGLTQAVQGFIAGRDARYRHDEIDRQKQQRAALDQINTKIGETVKGWESEATEGQRKAWLDAGNSEVDFKPQPFRLDDSRGFELGQMREQMLMQGGFYDEAVKNQAAIAQQRLRVRQSALEQFRASRDHAKLIQAVAPTLGMGKIKDVQTVEGAEALESAGSNMPARPTEVVITMEDGKVIRQTPQEIEALALQLANPNYIEQEAQAKIQKEFAELQSRLAEGREERGDVRRHGQARERDAENRDFTRERDETRNQYDIAGDERRFGQQIGLANLGHRHALGQISAREAAARRSSEGPSPADIAKRIGEYEEAFGFKLSSDERTALGKAAIGIKPGADDSTGKLRELLEKTFAKRVENGEIPEAEFGPRVEAAMRSVVGVQQRAVTEQLLAQARNKNEVGKFITDMLQSGLDEKELQAIGVKPAEIREAKNAGAKPSARASAPPAPPGLASVGSDISRYLLTEPPPTTGNRVSPETLKLFETPRR
jgi:hypothetical protein